MIRFRDSPHPQDKPHVTVALDHHSKCGRVLFLLVSPLLTQPFMEQRLHKGLWNKRASEQGAHIV